MVDTLDRLSRVVIVCDGKKWHVRRLRTITHDLEHDEKVYRCDQPISSDHATLDDAVNSLRVMGAPGVPLEIAQLLKRARQPLVCDTIDGVDQESHPSGPIDDLIEELADALEKSQHELERMRRK